MASPVEAALAVNSLKERVIVALDVDSAEAARDIVGELAGEVGAFKIGLQLYAACGPDLVREFTTEGHKIFLDLKFHDIPNTVAKASIEAARLGVWMFNVHASGGAEMMEAAKNAVDEVCDTEQLTRPYVIGVTVLTSSTANTLREAGIEHSPADQVVRLARLASESGLDGVVASPLESEAIRKLGLGDEFLVVTPGIRPINATQDDQKRVTTLGQAIAAGSTYVVVGRPVTAATDRRAALKEILSN